MPKRPIFARTRGHPETVGPSRLPRDERVREMRAALIIALLTAPAWLSCGRRPGAGAGSLEELGRRLVEAVGDNDYPAVVAVYAPKAALDAALECPGGGLWAKVERELGEKARSLPGMAKQEPEFHGVDHGDDETRTIPVGGELDGCTAKHSVMVVRTHWKVALTFDGKREEKSLGGEAIELGGTWYLLTI